MHQRKSCCITQMQEIQASRQQALPRWWGVKGLQGQIGFALMKKKLWLHGIRFLVLRKWEFGPYERSARCHCIRSFLSQPDTRSESFALYTCFETITFVLQGVCSNKSRYGSIDNFDEKYVKMKLKRDAQTRLWLSSAIGERDVFEPGIATEVSHFPI